MMRNEGKTGMPRVRRPGFRHVPPPFVQELLNFQKKIRELDRERKPWCAEVELEQNEGEMPEDSGSADSTVPSEGENDEGTPYECYGCGKKMENYYSAIRTYFRDYHYCQDCSQNGTKEEKERERTEALCQELKRWGEHLRERFDSER
jgi:hypothetical protein